jgi:maltooligosyltrehalose trehalohydrolase
MPVAAFAGSRGWGYDGVAWYAPFAPYGTPDDLRALVDAIHGAGMAVFLDVVYNHVGPAGSFLREFSPRYFTATIRNAWGDALNYSEPVLRNVIVNNARYWLEEFRFDGLRLDAIHAMADPSPVHILRELCRGVAEIGPKRFVIAEDNRNDPSFVTDIGLDGVWADDFHHAVRTTLTGEQDSYYGAFPPGTDTIARTIVGGWYYRGQLNPISGKVRGKPAGRLAASAFVYCIQNHDQIGNRALGDRLSAVVSPDHYRAASTLLLFLPMTPLLFMGQEWAAKTPFLYFTDHNPELGIAISRGRREEFMDFRAFSDPEARERIPDPQLARSFERSRLNWNERDGEEARATLNLYRSMLALRRTDPVLRHGTRAGLSAKAVDEVLLVRREAEGSDRVLLVNFGRDDVRLREVLPDASVREILFASDGQTQRRRVLAGGTAIILK